MRASGMMQRVSDQPGRLVEGIIGAMAEKQTRIGETAPAPTDEVLYRQQCIGVGCHESTRFQ
jgi:hypothetical protein